jgi:hypothetical protein
VKRIAYFFTFVRLMTKSMKQLCALVVAASVGLPTGSMSSSDITPPVGPIGGRAVIPEEYSYRYVFIPWLRCGFRCSSYSCIPDNCHK